MDVFTNVPPTTTEKWMARLRRFIRWLSKPQVLLSLTMLVVMFVMVVIPLYRLVETTVTYQAHDLTRVPDAVEGKLTSYHWVRMLTGIFGRIYTYTPLQHSMTIAIGHPVGLLIGGSLAWLVVRTDMPGRKLVNQLAVLPYIMPSWTLAQAWLVLFKNRTSGGTPGVFEFLVGQAPPDWLVVWTGADHHLLCAALLHLLFPVRFCGADVDRFQPGRSRGADGRQPLAHPAQDHLPAGPAGPALRFHHDLFQGDGHLWRTEYPGFTGQVLCGCHHDPRQSGSWRQGGCLCAGDRLDPVCHGHHFHQPETGRHTARVMRRLAGVALWRSRASWEI